MVSRNVQEHETLDSSQKSEMQNPQIQQSISTQKQLLLFYYFLPTDKDEIAQTLVHCLNVEIEKLLDVADQSGVNAF